MSRLPNPDSLIQRIEMLERQIEKAEKAKSEAESLLLWVEMNSQGYVWGKSEKGYRYKTHRDLLRRQFKNEQDFDILFARLFKLTV